MPYLFHNDEGNEIIRAMQLGAGDYNFARISKGGFFYLLFVEYGILFVVLMALGVVSSPAEFAEYFVREPSLFYLIARITAAIIGAATVYLVYRIARHAYSAAAGLFAAGLLAVNVLHTNLSHYATVDVPMTALATGSMYFAVKMVTDGSERDYLWAALLAALATTTKISAILLIIPLLVAHFYFWRDRNRDLRSLFLGAPLWKAIAVFTVAYIVTTPGILLFFDRVISNQLDIFTVGLTNEEAAELPEDGMRAATNLFLYYANVLLQSMGWPVFLVSLAGLAYGLVRRSKVDIVLISFAVPVYVVMSLSNDPHLFFPRYVLPAIPMLAILGGRLLADGTSLLQGTIRGGAVAAAALVLGIMPLQQIVTDNYMMTRKDTRAIAKEWFDANVPEGSKVFIEGTRARPIESTVPLMNSIENLRAEIAASRQGGESGRARYFEITSRARSDIRYDLVTVRPAELLSLQEYKEAGVEYFVLRPDAYPQSRQRYAWPKFVESIRSDPSITLVQRFEPRPGSTPGPLLEIYRVNSPGISPASPVSHPPRQSASSHLGEAAAH